MDMKTLMLLCVVAATAGSESSEEESKTTPEITDEKGKFKHFAYGRPDFAKR